MAGNISNFSELYHRFHACELHVRQGKIASCLISFKDIIDRIPSIPATDKEKKELEKGIQGFLKNLSVHKKFKEIFGEVDFGDTDLATNLEFMKSMITAEEQEIVQRIEKEEEAAEAQRLEIGETAAKKKEGINQQTIEAIGLIDEGDIPQAMKIIQDNEEMKEKIVLHYNAIGIQNREIKNFDEAVNNYNKALSVTPEDENLHYNIARAYFEKDKPDRAEELLEKALQLNPEFKEGKLLYEYLRKLEQAKTDNNGSKSGGKIGTIFHKIFSSKK